MHASVNMCNMCKGHSNINRVRMTSTGGLLQNLINTMQILFLDHNNIRFNFCNNIFESCLINYTVNVPYNINLVYYVLCS